MPDLEPRSGGVLSFVDDNFGQRLSVSRWPAMSPGHYPPWIEVLPRRPSRGQCLKQLRLADDGPDPSYG